MCLKTYLEPALSFDSWGDYDSSLFGSLVSQHQKTNHLVETVNDLQFSHHLIRDMANDSPARAHDGITCMKALPELQGHPIIRTRVCMT
jgi:hypothetical protein